MGLLDGKVAVVTGAGGGLGRAHAMALAAEGAAVVVNDLGGARDGSGGGSAMADAVVAEIRAAGGRAVANYASVADADGAASLVATALDAFGRLDVVVNNAGILRDRTLLKLSDEEFDLVVAVHLRGTYLCTKAALAHLREAGHGGAIINTSSYAGLIGNFGQSNYGAAKAGIAGFTRVVALEAGRMGVTVNAIAPLAKTRMTEDIAAVPADITPEQIAPFVVFLASDLAKAVTGRIFGTHGPQIFEYRQIMTPGVTKTDGPWTPDEIARRLPDIAAMPGAAPKAADDTVEKVRALFLAIPLGFRADKAGDWAATLHFKLGSGGEYTLRAGGGKAEAVEGLDGSPTATITIDSGETLLAMAKGDLKPEQAFMAGKIKADKMGELIKFGQFFNLKKVAAGGASSGAPSATAGASTETAGANRALIGKLYKGPARHVRPEDAIAYARATDDPNPRYVEGDTAPVLFAVKPVMDAIAPLVTDPSLHVDLLRLVHGEQEMWFHRPLRHWDLVYPTASLLSVEDKSSGQLLKVKQRLLVDGDPVVEIVSGYFVRGEKRGGGEKKEAPPAPVRELILDATQEVAADQPIRYGHASGDRNPIHMDEKVAQAAGHPTTILHGLCTMAFAAKALVDGLCGGDPAGLARLSCRFTRTVLPGDRLTTRAWREGEALGVEVVNQRGELVLANGSATLR